jgi:hypothetical protein
MAVIINASINLNSIPKNKIIDGKKGKYLPITITVNDDADTFGNQGPIIVAQSKEERESKEPKVYLGNVKVAWTDGKMTKADDPGYSSREATKATAKPITVADDDDLPF